MYLSIFSYCGCSDAAPKEKNLELACPYILPAEKDLPVGWEIIGKIPSDKLQLQQVGIIDGNATVEKKRVSLTQDRMFTEEMIDEWEDFKDRSEAHVEYDINHTENSLKCIYAKSYKETFDVNLHVVLLVPLPKNKELDCLLVRRDVEPKHEISCKVK